jgi:poly(3-hydroxybutyrate) depolymerase
MGSAGCGRALADATEQWVAKTLDVGGTMREYFVYLPAGYDSERPYPVVYQFHGCSNNADRQNNNPPVHDYSGSNAIVIRGKAVADCWDTAADGTGVALFDALVPEVESTWCADPARRFATGYSGGSFMTHRLACVRGDVLHGVASIAGGQAGNNCVGQVAALLIHDDTDGTVNITASEGARDRHLSNNNCDAQAATTPDDHPPCGAYAGCDADLPVTWCQTTGMGHSRQDSLSAPAFWAFLVKL